MKKIILIGTVLSTVLASAQQGIGTKDPHRSSVLELKSKKRGLLIPRVKLKATNLTEPVDGTPAPSLLVYNTGSSEASIAEANKVSPGYYYWNGSKWVRVIDADSQVETEWVYDESNQHIKLKRSGTSPFANQVYYDANGGFKSLDFNEYVGVDYNDNESNYYSSDFKKTSNITTIGNNLFGSNFPLKTKERNLLLIDENTNGLGVNNFVSGTIVDKDNSANIEYVSGFKGLTRHEGDGDVKNLYGAEFFNILEKGTSSGIMAGVRNYTSVKGGGNINRVVNDYSRLSVNKTGGKVTDMAIYNGGLQYSGATDVETAYGLIINQYVKLGDNAVIDETAGIRYEGFKRSEGTTTINNHYGIYLDNIDGATNNYSIYTNAGKAYFGDKVGIGVNNPTEKLEVLGKVKANAFIAKSGAFPDYVFEKYYNGYSNLKADYDFYSLETVENFIKKNGHLPGYQSAKEVAKEGFDMSATQLANVEKIEELYLHTIEQDKTIKAKTAKIEQMEAELNAQRKEIDELKSLVNKLINK